MAGPSAGGVGCPEAPRDGVLAGVVPRYTPMQATQVKQPFHREGCVCEEKIDGWRMLAYKDGRNVRLESRKGVDHTRRFPGLANAVAALSTRTLVLDGEVAIFDRQLRSRFDWLRDPNHEEVADAAPADGLRSALPGWSRFDQAPSARPPHPASGNGATCSPGSSISTGSRPGSHGDDDLRDQLRARVDEWHGLLAGQPVIARQILRTLLPGRLTLTPKVTSAGRTWAAHERVTIRRSPRGEDGAAQRLGLKPSTLESRIRKLCVAR